MRLEQLSAVHSRGPVFDYFVIRPLISAGAFDHTSDNHLVIGVDDLFRAVDVSAAAIRQVQCCTHGTNRGNKTT